MLRIEIDLDVLVIYGIVAVTLVLLLFVFWDIHYFIRMFLTIWWPKLFQSRLKLDDTVLIYGLCTTNDVDFNLWHMNNARYVRELDFARLHFCERTGIYQAVMRSNGTVLHSTTCIQYFAPIGIFSPYKIKTKLTYWNDRLFYLEHNFVSCTDEHNYASVISKVTVFGLDLHKVICTLLNKDLSYKPTMSEELVQMCKFNALSSTKLRRSE